MRDREGDRGSRQTRARAGVTGSSKAPAVPAAATEGAAGHVPEEGEGLQGPAQREDEGGDAGTLGGPDSFKGKGRRRAGREKQEGEPLGRLSRVREVLIPGALFELIASY